MRSTAVASSLAGLAIALAFSGAALSAQTTQTSPAFGTAASRQAHTLAPRQGAVLGQTVRTRALANRRRHLPNRHMRHSRHYPNSHMRRSRRLTTGVRHGAAGAITTPNGNTVTLPGSNTSGHGAIVQHMRHHRHVAHHARHALHHTRTLTRHKASTARRGASGATGIPSRAPSPAAPSSQPPGAGMSRTPGMTGSGTAVPGDGNGAAGTIHMPNGHTVALPGSRVNGGATMNGQSAAPGAGGIAAPDGGGASGAIYIPGGNTAALPGSGAQMQGRGSGLAGGIGGLGSGAGGSGAGGSGGGSGAGGGAAGAGGGGR